MQFSINNGFLYTKNHQYEISHANELSELSKTFIRKFMSERFPNDKARYRDETGCAFLHCIYIPENDLVLTFDEATLARFAVLGVSEII